MKPKLTKEYKWHDCIVPKYSAEDIPYKIFYRKGKGFYVEIDKQAMEIQAYRYRIKNIELNHKKIRLIYIAIGLSAISLILNIVMTILRWR